MFLRKIASCMALGMLILTACESAANRIESKPTEAKSSGGKFTPDGSAVFRKYCVTCHGADGKLGLNGAKDLTQSTLTLDERLNIITHGKKLMTPFGELLSPEEIKAVAEYTLSLKK